MSQSSSTDNNDKQNQSVQEDPSTIHDPSLDRPSASVLAPERSTPATSEGYPSWLPKSPRLLNQYVSTVNSEVFARFGMMPDTPQISEVPRAMTTQQGRKPTPRSIRIINTSERDDHLRDATDTTFLHPRGHPFHDSFRGKGTPVPP
jgi:hypothetical protein